MADLTETPLRELAGDGMSTTSDRAFAGR
jgi:hypothetical protein